LPSRLRPCPDCSRPLSPTARACPNCGYVTDKTPSRLGTLFLIIFVLAGLYAISRAMNL
jgi:RNA polymerase subunit RPABC4/transcription elongation factor Spt4